MKNKYFLLTLIILLSISFAIRLNYVEKSPNGQDSIFYHKAAIDLSKFSKPTIYVNNEAHPTMVFLGFPFILSIFYIIFGKSYLIGVLVTISLSVLSLFLIYKTGEKLFNPIAGLIASTILAFSPLHLILSTSVLSDIPSLALISLAIYVYFWNNGKYKPHIFGALLGINFFIRFSSIILIFLPLFDNILNKRRFHKDYNKISLGFFPFLLLFLLINHLFYGNPFTSGYDYYEEKFDDLSFFDIASPFPRFAGETLQEKLGGIIFYIYSFVHGGNLIDSFAATFATFSSIVLLLMAVSLFSLRKNEPSKNKAIMIFALAMSNLILYSFQTYYGVRYMLVTYSLLILLAGGGLEKASRLVNTAKFRTLLIFFALILILVPSLISALPYLVFFHNNQLPIVYAIKYLDKNAGENSIIVSDYFVHFGYYSNKTAIPIRILNESSISLLVQSNSTIYFVEDFYTRMQPTKCFNENKAKNNISETKLRTKHCRVYNIINMYPASKMVFDYVIKTYNTTRYMTPFGVNYYKITGKV